jgi:hypothetical protein
MDKLLETRGALIAFGAIISLFIAFGFYYSKLKVNQLKQFKKITTCYVYDYRSKSDRNSTVIILKINMNGIISEKRILTDLSNAEKIKNHYISLITDTTDYDNYRFLVTRSDFEKFGYNYPDSLNKLNLIDKQNLKQQINNLINSYSTNP